MDKKTISALLFPLAALVVSPTWAGHITLDNQTGQSLRMECGEHGHSKSTGKVQPGHTAGVPHSHGQVRCRAIDGHGETVESRTFDFDHGEEKVVWRVRGHNSGGGGHHGNQH